MFKGTVPPDMQKIIFTMVKTWDVDDLYFGCLGNFTNERVLQSLGKRLHSCDVSLYTSVLGRYFSGEPIELEINDEFHPDLEWLKDFLVDDADKVATILLWSRIGDYYGKPQPYYQRMYSAYVKGYPSLHAKTKQKILNSTLKLSSYDCEDFLSWLKKVPDDAGLISFPPFYSKGYDKLWKVIESVFKWTPCEFSTISASTKMEIMESAIQKKYFCICIPEEIEGMEEYLRGFAKTTNRGVQLYIYTNTPDTRIALPHQSTEPLLIPHITKDIELKGDLKILPISFKQFTLLRSTYLNRGICPGQPDMMFAVICDGYLIGAFAFSHIDKQGQNVFASKVQTPAVYLLSDFPVANSRYKRLAKLILHSLMSVEAQRYAERRVKAKVRTIVTTAFTDKPVSMKYRGLFELIKREKYTEEAKKEHKTDMAYSLNYATSAGLWTLEDGFKEWMKKHGNDQI